MGQLAPVLAAGLDPLHFDPTGFLLNLVVFLVLFGLLLKYAWNPILDALDSREKRIESAVTSAETARRDAEKMIADYKQKLSDAERQVAQRIEEGRHAAARQAQTILDAAAAEADRERVNAKRDIDLEKQRALAEIRGEAVKLSRMIAEKVLEREISGPDHQRLADQVLAAMK